MNKKVNPKNRYNIYPDVLPPELDPTISKLRLILGLFKRDIERHYGGRTVGKTLNGDEAEQAIIAWALEAVDSLEPNIDIGGKTITAPEIHSHIEGYEHAVKDFKAKLTGGTE